MLAIPDLAQRTEHSYSLKLKVTTIGTEEHVALVMGKFLVQAVFKSEDAPLKGNFVHYEDNISDGLLPLNADVQFSSQDAFAAEVLRLSKMTLAPHRPDQEGGNCADYVKKVLEQLAAIPNALVPTGVPKEFTVWYAKNSERISEGTRAAMKQEHK
ncbi:hypothetical protein BDP27DRAFT_1317919 [Rhodocollybia butyracea]|uniref:Uncharacterized protein n=1 Tax=Rhodocollybia butyracea TaxID=206335 RepID=A0A9P5Q4R1_9AGAR|nr:hypothetical protein BDP27DRAFT_1317919 [Rhodocollybia butyracea]